MMTDKILCRKIFHTTSMTRAPEGETGSETGSEGEGGGDSTRADVDKRRAFAPIKIFFGKRAGRLALPAGPPISFINATMTG